ncbi:unnamed protein product [Symbiodinium necroappetens]|uniref:Microbial-type PARG catalytic domain-containing protein n=1 Tax=Symbiodinium necroappetens TaxID=1628268 RepID=A0A812X900_9DINO|nr:unnamed protein product [Symbiodinium necroappetens]
MLGEVDAACNQTPVQRSHRDFCKALAEETMEVLARGWYMTDTADDPVDISAALDRAMEVTEETSLQALYRIAEEAKVETINQGFNAPMLLSVDLSATMLLNFASAKNPGVSINTDFLLEISIAWVDPWWAVRDSFLRGTFQALLSSVAVSLAFSVLN